MKYYIIMLFCVAIISCTRHSTYVSKTYFINETTFPIKLIPYYKGEPFSIRILNVSPGTKNVVVEKSGRGKGGGETFAEEISFCDSLKIIYNATDSINHYNATISSLGNNLRGIYFNSNRSLYKRENFTRRILDESKRSIENEYTYTFTNQDYLDAQK